MKEKDAKTKWCPQSHGDNLSRCLGTGCMMWREGPPDFDTDEPTGECGFMPMTGLYVKLD